MPLHAMKGDKRFWLLAVLASLVVHTLFCMQAFGAASQGGMVLKRGHDLEQVLRFFDRGRFKVVD